MRLYEIDTTNILPFDVADVSSLPQYIVNYFNNESYFNKEKNIKITKTYMSTDEYINTAESMLSKNYGNSTISRKITGNDKIEKYAELMRQGTKFPLPYLSYIDNLQDGLHRVEAAKLIGIKSIPVLIVSKFNLAK